MDRLNQLRGAAGGSGDSTLDTTSPPSEAFITANESSSKYFSLSEVDSTFDISPIKDVSLASASADPERTITDSDELISNLSPISKKSDILDSYKIGKQIEAANILSGGVDIFDDNENSYDGDELVIDDNVEIDEKSNPELKQSEPVEFKSDDNLTESTLMDVETDLASKDTEVVLQIDGKNVDAINIGNGLYLYRKEGQEELAAVQIIDDDQHQSSFKFLKVRENTEGNLEVYEEIEIEVPKEVPVKEGRSIEKNTSHVPITDINKVINEPSNNKTVDKKTKTPQKETALTSSEVENDDKDASESKTEVNLNGKMMKFSESRKSPVIGTFTPMTYHSTPNKEGIPLTKTMVDMQLQPSRHSDNVKKTIEVHTDSCKQKLNDTSKSRDLSEDLKETDITITEKEDIHKEDNDSKSQETEATENVSNKTDMEIIDENDSNGKQETPEAIITESVPESIEVKNENEDSIALIMNDMPKDNVITPISGASEENNANRNTLEKIETKTSQSVDGVKIKGDSKDPDVDKADVAKIAVCNENEIQINKKTFKVEAGKALMTTVENKSSVSKGNEEQVPLVKNDDILPAEAVSQKIVKEDNSIDITNENKEQGALTSNSIVATDCPIIDLSDGMKKELIPEKLTKSSNDDEGKVIIVSHIEEIEDEKFMDDKNDSIKKYEPEMQQNTICDKVEEKKVGEITITPKLNDASENIKICDTKLVDDAKATTKLLEENKLLNINTETQVKDVDKNKMRGYNISEIFPVTKQIDSANKEKQKDKVNDTNDTKIQIHSKAIERHEAGHSNITVQKILTLNKTEGNKVPCDGSELTGAGNKSDLILKTENTKNSNTKPSTVKMEITSTKTVPTISNKEISKVNVRVDPKPSNNNNAAVPFGKWTEANRQEFLNKIKETKVPVNISNSKPIKNSNDLNRRDVLKKIDSQRQSNNAALKAQESSKINIKNEKVFTNKPVVADQDTVVHHVSQDSKIPVKVEATEIKTKAIVVNKKTAKLEISSKAAVKPTMTTSTVTGATKKGVVQRKAVNTQDLIDKTVEGIINKGFPPKTHATEVKSNSSKDSNVQKSVDLYPSQPSTVPPTTLDAIEMKMNELHGIPFIERPPHELPRPNNPPFNNYNKLDKEKPTENKPAKIPSLLPFSCKNTSKVKENVVDIDSEEEIIEHEPVTGDIEMTKKELPSNLHLKEKVLTVDTAKISAETTKKETIITENDFDKFARRNSVTYENCITVKFDGKEQHNVVQTVVEKDVLKAQPKNDVLCMEIKPKLAQKSQSLCQNINQIKLQPPPNTTSVNEDTSNTNYQSKLQIAYQSAINAKRHKEGPITVIEDKPVKVVYVDANPEFIPGKLNVQGQNLSPVKHPVLDMESSHTNESLELEMMDCTDDSKLQDESKPKSKHQRKQVLTPVETPELELIEPSDLGIEVSPKKKRKTEDTRTDKNSKNVIHKKSYLLGRSPIVEDNVTNLVEVTKSPAKDFAHGNEEVGIKDTVTAIDNLVKAAELLENQSESMNTSTEPTPDSQASTPVKRGRGRPRKYPLPEGAVDKVKVPSPHKKPRLIDAKPAKRDTTTEEEETSDEEIVKENWTMGKINENIVCPICNKLFRSENVVFKHVKHCTGPSPNRSDADKRSPRRPRQSQESDSKSEDMDIDEEISKDIKKYTTKKRRSKDSGEKSDSDKEDIIVIEDTPVKERVKNDDDKKHHGSRKLVKTKIHNRIVNNLVCEFCGKTFRQLSYLANHKLQHKKEEAKKREKDVQVSKSILICDVCKKEFRKLHHLVQHRAIHNPQSVSSRMSRKSSSEQEETKSEKEETMKQTEDPSAGFRCEPCDKSFRKLHHLVEHRETHGGINRQKNATTVQTVVEKPTQPPQCEICKKTFRKLNQLIEHKEQHLETSSEKSDDKSVKSSLSTKDIIHECPLCYMVFPNEHSLNKHSVICQRKKRQSKQPKPVVDEDGDTLEMDDNAKSDENKLEDNDEPEIIAEEAKVIIVEKNVELETVHVPMSAVNDDIVIIEKPPPDGEANKHQESPKVDTEVEKSNNNYTTKASITSEIPEAKTKIEQKKEEEIQDVPKKKTSAKSKATPTVTKRQRISAPAPIDIDKSPVETSDDDEVRYMLNPNLVVDESTEGKVFMKVRAKKRNSLQIERPNSKDLIKRRTSLQHPPKIPRLKPKPIEIKVTAPVLKNVAKTPKLEPVPSTDSDDSDVKYSFPKTTPERTILRERPSREMEKKPPRKSLAEKRKTLSGIAKRKSLGKTATVRYKEAKTTSPPKQVKRRTAEAEHRCDCGELFSSAALLSRHTTLAHTPPRIRRRRSPPPDTTAATTTTTTTTTKQTLASRKSSVRSDTTASNAKTTVATRKSTGKNDAKPDTRKSIKPVEKVEPKNANSTNIKNRRSISTRMSAVSDKAKKPTQKSKI